MAKAEEELKKLAPLSRKIRSEMENMKDKKYLRLYKLQIYDSQKNATNVSSSDKFDEILDVEDIEDQNK